MPKILGIDLGTTNSAMAIIEGGEPKVLENHEGQRITPSVVALTKGNEKVIGILAKRQQITNPENTIYSVKRLIGRKFSDPEVQRDKQTFSFKIREGENQGVEIKMGDRWYKPEEISAMVLKKLKLDAEAKLGETINEAVITVPAYFDDSQRQATKVAGEIAGFKVRRIINEPTAASLAYGLNKNKEERILVYDFGGGTFDVSILEVGENVVEVKATGGDTHLGGDDIDREILNYLITEYKKAEGIDLSKDPLALQRLKEAAERAKQELSSSFETEINLPYISSDAAGPKHFLMKLTRAKLEELAESYINRSIELVKKTLDEAKLTPADIDQIILVGGQTRMPKIVEKVRELFNKEPHKGINPDEVVALGAAVQAGIFQGDVKDVLLLDVTPLTLSIETLGGIATPMIPKNTTIPTSKTQIFSTAADNQTSVEIHVVQGERPMAADNKTLGRFILDGIPPAPRGVPQIEVTFDIDANGILNVTAKDKATGKSQSVRIEGSINLSEEEVERMKQEAEAYAKQDREKKELVQVRNQADAAIHAAEKFLNEYKDKIPDDKKQAVNSKIENLKKAKETNNLEQIKTALDELNRALSEIGREMYKQKQPPQSPSK